MTASTAQRGNLRLVRDDERAPSRPTFPPAFAASEHAQKITAELREAYADDPAALAAELIWFGFEYGAFAEMKHTDDWKARYEAIRLTYGARSVTA